MNKMLMKSDQNLQIQHLLILKDF